MLSGPMESALLSENRHNHPNQTYAAKQKTHLGHLGASNSSPYQPCLGEGVTLQVQKASASIINKD